MPQLGQTVGGDALPGPHLGMQPQQLEPAMLESVDEEGGADGGSGGADMGGEGAGRGGGGGGSSGGGGENDGVDEAGGPVKKKGRRQRFNSDGSPFTGSDEEWAAAKAAKKAEQQRARRVGPAQEAARVLQDLHGLHNELCG